MLLKRGKGVGRKIFRGGPIRIEPVLTTKNGRIFEIWELLERVRENPGGGHGSPLPPLADAHETWHRNWQCNMIQVVALLGYVGGG